VARSGEGKRDDGPVRRVRVVVSGRVQGVFFRATCADLAMELGIAGSVRNVPGGSVEAVFEGAPTGVQTMIDWCRHGPPAARVAGVDVIDEPPANARGFEVVG
jgi:acylphosphatase